MSKRKKDKKYSGHKCFWCRKPINRGQKMYGVYYMRFHHRCSKEIEIPTQYMGIWGRDWPVVEWWDRLPFYKKWWLAFRDKVGDILHWRERKEFRDSLFSTHRGKDELSQQEDKND